MPAIIEFTLAENGIPVYINAENIKKFLVQANLRNPLAKGTYIEFVGGDGVYVAESPEDVASAIENANDHHMRMFAILMGN